MVSEADIAQARSWARQHGFDAILSTDGDGDRPLLAMNMATGFAAMSPAFPVCAVSWRTGGRDDGELQYSGRVMWRFFQSGAGRVSGRRTSSKELSS